ncbi:MAG: isopentenyl phosphate kinase [Candidatus Thorarchaeota archaeon]|nr:MAG: hypothetical protein DRP09_07810 [Candidatus Thorarchaeota archaeon]
MILSPLTVIKLGGSVITKKRKSPPEIDKENVLRIAKELRHCREKLIVVLGGGAHGHQAAHAYGYGRTDTDLEELLSGIPLIRHNMSLLSLEIETQLNHVGIPSVVIPPFPLVIMKDGEILSFPLDTLIRVLDANIAVIIHGDVCMDDVRGASILSGDTIVAHLAKELNASRVLIGTDVDGIFSANPSIDTDATLIPKINKSNIDEILESAGPSSSTDVTGGMHRKLLELMSLARGDSQVRIFNLSVPGRLTRLLDDESTICTTISE